MKPKKDPSRRIVNSRTLWEDIKWSFGFDLLTFNTSELKNLKSHPVQQSKSASSIDYVEIAIKSMKSYKALGYDQITAEMLESYLIDLSRKWTQFCAMLKPDSGQV